MSTDVQAAIDKELHSMSRDEILAELAKLKDRKAKLKARAADPEARKKYYEKAKNDPEWQAKRKVQAAKRKARDQALLAMAKKLAAQGALDPETAKVLGI